LGVLLRGGLRGKRVDDTFCVLDFFFKFLISFWAFLF
jgi:hypothetical protein